MARHTRWALASVLLAALTAPLQGSALQAEHQQPQAQQAKDPRRDGNDRRPWWKNPKDMAEIGLSADQSAEIDRIFHEDIAKMRPLRETVNGLERALDETMRANTADIDAFARQVNKIESKRAELNSMRTVMLYRMRRVLNADQNARFQAMLDRQREAERRKQEGDRRH